MNARKLFIGLAALGASAAAWSQAASPAAAVASPAAVAADTVVLRAGEVKLTKEQYEKMTLGFDRAVGAVLTGANPQSVQSGQEVARLLALVAEAQRRKLDVDPKMQELIRVRTYVLLANGLLRSLQAEVKADEAGTRALWNSEKNNYIDIVARQILIRHKGATVDNPKAAGLNRSQEQALALAQATRLKLIGGADFAAVAQASSDDETTRLKGGEMPAFTRGAMQAEFEMAAFGLPVGEVSEPVKTKYGYHLIKVTERRPYPFERVRGSLEFARAQQKFEALGAAGIELNSTYFKP